MFDFNCDEIQLAATVIADGEVARISSSQIEQHQARCNDCRSEIEQLRAQSMLLNSLLRRPQSVRIWPVVHERLFGPSPESRMAKTRFWILLPGILLAIYKLVDLLPDRQHGLWFKVLPILLVIFVFGYRRENPFKINTDLKLEGVQ